MILASLGCPRTNNLVDSTLNHVHFLNLPFINVQASNPSHIPVNASIKQPDNSHIFCRYNILENYSGYVVQLLWNDLSSSKMSTSWEEAGRNGFPLLHPLKTAHAYEHNAKYL